MGFFDQIRGIALDKTRDNICAGLQSLGIDAQMAERGRREEKIGGKGSLGLIDIPEGPISWINVRKETQHGGQGGRYTYDEGPFNDGGSYTDYYIEYGVPDRRLSPGHPEYRIISVRIKTPPLFDQVSDLHWKGEDFGLGIIDRLDSDISLKQPIMKSHDVIIRAHGDHMCWIISTTASEVPSGELWNCYQAIARHLLAEWPH